MKAATLTSLAVAVALSAGASGWAAEMPHETDRTVTIVSPKGGPQAVIVDDMTMLNGDITATAGKLPEDTEVSVAGKVESKDGGSFVIDRPDGQVRARLTADHDDRVAVGDTVTVYGRLKWVPENLAEIQTEAVSDKTNGQSYLTDLGNTRIGPATGSTPVRLSYHHL